MEPDAQLLQEKALLLITRERELNTLRNKHQRLLNWLMLSQSLPDLVDRRYSLAEMGAKFISRIVASVKLQRAQLLEIAPDCMRPFGKAEPRYPALPDEAMAEILRSRSGLSNEPTSAAERALADIVKLHRMLWYRLDVAPEHVLLLVGGFDLQRASSYMPFDAEDREYFANAGQHFESILRNVLLLNELEQDKLRLERFNDELEDRVRERTKELARANQEIGNAFASLREKDRRLSEDLAQARTFQQSILPVLPQSDWIEFGAVYRALDMVGGDIYDVAKVGPDKYRIFVADATGHGVQASLRTIVIKSEYDRIKHGHALPDTLLLELNRRLVETYSENEMLCTACCCDITLDSAGANLCYTNAAHPPLLHGAKSGIGEIYQSGPFLGLDASISLRSSDRRLATGEVIIALTDGISEQLGPGGELFNLASALEQCDHREQPVEQVLWDLCANFDQFRGHTAQGDDVTLVAARITHR